MLKILAIIPARGGSKAIPLKNLYKLNKKPLIQYTIQTAINSNIFTKIVVSSDNKKILNFSKNLGKYPCIIDHPNTKDNSSTDSVINSVLKDEIKNNINYDYICVIEPTSPLRSIKSLIKAYEYLKKQCSSLITINLFENYYGFIKNDRFNYLSKSFLPRQKKKIIY